MNIIHTTKELVEFLAQIRHSGQPIGFAPTMGAIHAGHTTLVRQSKERGAFTVSSIFVNPTQFNDPKDYELYPRTIESDAAQLAAAGCDCLFVPASEGEIYPPDFDFSFELDLSGLDSLLEGAHRPGHFKGVVQVVKRLLEIVQPDFLFMGQKDLQQYSICKRLIQLCHIPTRIVRVPTVRESDGLAMSSRNVRLSAAGRALAPIIHRTLHQIEQDYRQGMSLNDTLDRAHQVLAGEPSLGIDYLEICDLNTMSPIREFDETHDIAVLTAIRIDGVRLLDNLVLSES